jgi:hypothetical protein
LSSPSVFASLTWSGLPLENIGLKPAPILPPILHQIITFQLSD